MDLELAALASTAAGTLVSLMTTSGWERVVTIMSGIWQRNRPDQAGSILTEMQEGRLELLEMHPRHRPAMEASLTAEWEARLRRLLSRDPEAAEALRAFLEEVAPQKRSQAQTTFNATSHDHSRIYQSGRDMTVES